MRLAISLLAMVTTACGSADASSEWSEWQLVELDGQRVEGSYVTLRLNEADPAEQRASEYTLSLQCDQYRGAVSDSGRANPADDVAYEEGIRCTPADLENIHRLAAMFRRGAALQADIRYVVARSPGQTARFRILVPPTHYG